MISLSEQNPIFNEINQGLQSKSNKLITQLKELKLPYETKSNIDLQENGFNINTLYCIKNGILSVEQDEKELYILETGESFIYLPSQIYTQTNLNYSTKHDAEIECWPLDKLYLAFANNPSLIQLFISIMTLSQIQLMQIIGALTQVDERAAPGFKRFSEGEVIIQEGDDADYVYSVANGVAEVTHNGVHVGNIANEEIFGAIAVLTDQKRTATVTAKTNCTVLMVHKDEFQKMAHSHPHIFISVLKSLASNILALNEKVSVLTNKNQSN